MFKKFPRLLVVQCNRTCSKWSNEEFSFKNSKKETFVELSDKLKNQIDLTQYAHPDTLKNRSTYKYNLVATLNHHGSLEDGTYSATCSRTVNPTTPGYKKWYSFKDLSIEEVNRDFAVQRTTYCFVFELEAHDQFDEKEEEENCREWTRVQQEKKSQKLEKAKQEYQKK